METNVIYCGDNLDVLPKYVHPESVDLIYIDPPFNSNRIYEVFWGEAVEKRAEVRREYLGEKPDKKEKESTIFLNCTFCNISQTSQIAVRSVVTSHSGDRVLIENRLNDSARSISLSSDRGRKSCRREIM